MAGQRWLVGRERSKGRERKQGKTKIFHLLQPLAFLPTYVLLLGLRFLSFHSFGRCPVSARPWARWVPGRRRSPGKEHTALSEQTLFLNRQSAWLAPGKWLWRKEAGDSQEGLSLNPFRQAKHFEICILETYPIPKSRSIEHPWEERK